MASPLICCRQRWMPLRPSPGMFARAQRLHYQSLLAWNSQLPDILAPETAGGVGNSPVRTDSPESIMEEIGLELIQWIKQSITVGVPEIVAAS